MTTLAPIRTIAARDSRPGGAGGGLTLDALVVGLWEELTAHAVVRCPACGEAMEPRYGAHAIVVEGRCRRCGSVLS
ncbi:MAG: hypothetical protein ACR2OB_11490 [Solirubrobacteraceae bacterium]